MRIARLAYLCLLFWAGSFVSRSSADDVSRPSALPAPAPARAEKRKLEAAELKQLLGAALQAERIKDAGELEIQLTRPWQPIDVPDQPLGARILEMPVSTLGGQFVMRFELRAGSEALGAYQTAVQVRLWREIWVAGSALKRGESLERADVCLRRVDVLPLRDYMSELPSRAQAYEVAEFVPPGGPITARSLKMRPVVRRGQTVDAVAQNGALTVTLRVEALEEGAPGQLIRLRNPQSRRELRGKVQDENTVVVPL